MIRNKFTYIAPIYTDFRMALVFIKIMGRNHPDLKSSTINDHYFLIVSKHASHFLRTQQTAAIHHHLHFSQKS